MHCEKPRFQTWANNSTVYCFSKITWKLGNIFVVMVRVDLDCGSVVVDDRLVGLALQGIPVPSVAGFTSSSGRTSVLSSFVVDVIYKS